jgi:hypothetical protein
MRKRTKKKPEFRPLRPIHGQEISGMDCQKYVSVYHPFSGPLPARYDIPCFAGYIAGDAVVFGAQKYKIRIK